MFLFRISRFVFPDGTAFVPNKNTTVPSDSNDTANNINEGQYANEKIYLPPRNLIRVPQAYDNGVHNHESNDQLRHNSRAKTPNSTQRRMPNKIEQAEISHSRPNTVGYGHRYKNDNTLKNPSSDDHSNQWRSVSLIDDKKIEQPQQ